MDKLIVVESPTKLKKLEVFFKESNFIADWSFGKESLRRSGAQGPEVAVPMATSGHFMRLSELTWEMMGGEAAPPATTPPQIEAAAPISSASASMGAVPPLQAHFNFLWETVPGKNIHEAFSSHLSRTDAEQRYSEIIVATDPDREGELIAMHVHYLLKKMYSEMKIPFTRAYMHSLTHDGVKKAMEERSELFDWNLAHAAQARHGMDRIFGFLGSCVVRHAHPMMRSVGRVQTPSLILIRQREEKIQAMKEAHTSYFSVTAKCTVVGKRKSTLSQTVVLRVDENSPEGAAAKAAREDKSKMEQLMKDWKLDEIKQFSLLEAPVISKSVSHPPEPLTMAVILTRANRMYQYSSTRIALALQELFQHGLITYPRTDSTRIDSEELELIYKQVAKEYGAKLVQKRVTQKIEGRRGGEAGDGGEKSAASSNVEDAHEAIRPTNIGKQVSELSTSISGAAVQLYDLIRRHTLASCMAALQTEKVVARVKPHLPGESEKALWFKLEGSRTVQEGWSKAFSKDGGKRKRGSEKPVQEPIEVAETLLGAAENAELDVAAKEPPPVVSKDEFKLLSQWRHKPSSSSASSLPDEQLQISLSHFQLKEKPSRCPLPYTEGGLIADLRKHGVGRPSTYPSIVQTLLNRQYIKVNAEQRLETTDVGRLLTEVSRSMFPSIVDISFTAKFEKELDVIAKPPKAVPSTAPATGEETPAAVLAPTEAAVKLSTMDQVLSRFTAVFLHFVLEATRKQRAHRLLVTAQPTLVQAAGDSGESAGAPHSVAAEPKELVPIPDLISLSTKLRTFSAVQSQLKEFLFKYFPRATTAVDGSPIPKSSFNKRGRKTSRKGAITSRKPSAPPSTARKATASSP